MIQVHNNSKRCLAVLGVKCHSWLFSVSLHGSEQYVIAHTSRPGGKFCRFIELVSGYALLVVTLQVHQAGSRQPVVLQGRDCCVLLNIAACILAGVMMAQPAAYDDMKKLPF
jgi:hypothetical protein